jgi:hypothetical protein
VSDWWYPLGLGWAVREGLRKIVDTSSHSDQLAAKGEFAPIGAPTEPAPRTSGSAAAFLAMVRRDRLVVVITCLVLVIDVGFLLLHVGNILTIEKMWPYQFFANPRFDLMESENYAALFKVFMAGLMTIFFLRAFALSRQPIYAAGAGVIIAVAAIGGFAIHAWAGELLGERLGLVARYPEMGRHMAEAMVVAVVGGLIFLLLVGAAWLSTGWHRGFGKVVIVLFIVLGFFAGGVDLMHALLFYENIYLVWALQVIEDAGELSSITMLCAVAAVAARQRHHLMPAG